MVLKGGRDMNLGRKSLGHNLRLARQLNGFSGVDIAKQIKVTAPAYRRYERDEVDIPVRTLLNLCQIYRCSLDALVYKGGDEAEDSSIRTKTVNINLANDAELKININRNEEKIKPEPDFSKTVIASEKKGDIEEVSKSKMSERLAELPFLITVSELAQFLFGSRGKKPSRGQIFRIYNFVKKGQLTPIYKTKKKVQFFVQKEEVEKLIESGSI